MATKQIIINRKTVCDLCGKWVTPRKGIHRSDDFVYLCADCLKRVEALPASVKADVEERLIGNVI